MDESDILAEEMNDKEPDEILKILRRGIKPPSKKIDHNWICGTPFIERPVHSNPTSQK